MGPHPPVRRCLQLQQARPPQSRPLPQAACLQLLIPYNVQPHGRPPGLQYHHLSTLTTHQDASTPPGASQGPQLPGKAKGIVSALSTTGSYRRFIGPFARMIERDPDPCAVFLHLPGYLGNNCSLDNLHPSRCLPLKAVLINTIGSQSHTSPCTQPGAMEKRNSRVPCSSQRSM